VSPFRFQNRDVFPCLRSRSRIHSMPARAAASSQRPVYCEYVNRLRGARVDIVACFGGNQPTTPPATISLSRDSRPARDSRCLAWRRICDLALGIDNSQCPVAQAMVENRKFGSGCSRPVSHGAVAALGRPGRAPRPGGGKVTTTRPRPATRTGLYGAHDRLKVRGRKSSVHAYDCAISNAVIGRQHN
jgi:hypothetical protein